MKFLGTRVDDITTPEVVSRVTEALSVKQSLRIATVNPELVMLARKNAAFQTILGDSAIVTPDGIGLLMIGRLTGRRLRQRTTGVDLCDALAAAAAEHGWRLYLLGAGPDVAAAAAKALQARYPKLVIAGTSAADPDDADVAAIRNTQPDILLVAYGSPTQELWLAKHQADTGAAIAMGVGGSFDFIAGVTHRAPRLWQTLGLEWLYRLIRQPHRWRRMLALPQFTLLALFERR